MQESVHGSIQLPSRSIRLSRGRANAQCIRAFATCAGIENSGNFLLLSDVAITSTKGRNQELDTQAVWGQTLKALRDQIPAHIYETRLKDTSFLGMDGNTAIVEVSSYYMVEQLERFYRSIAGTLEQVLGQKVEIEFVSAAALERQ